MKIFPGFAILFLLATAVQAELAYINQIADFTQTDITFAGSGNGQQFCAPVAVSNSLVTMGGGYQQLEMISLLASSNYMNTSLVNGTGTTGVLRGVNRIASEMFGGYRLLEYQGWRKHPKKYSTGSRLPDLDRLKSAISRRSAAWLNVGWYRYHRQKNEYRRIGGHWVTLAGFDEDRLVIHDPAPRAGSSFANEFVEFEVIEDGLLVGDKAGLPVEARGYLKLGNGFHVKRGADFAILDGVVFFAL